MGSSSHHQFPRQQHLGGMRTNSSDATDLTVLSAGGKSRETENPQNSSQIRKLSSRKLDQPQDLTVPDIVTWLPVLLTASSSSAPTASAASTASNTALTAQSAQAASTAHQPQLTNGLIEVPSCPAQPAVMMAGATASSASMEPNIQTLTTESKIIPNPQDEQNGQKTLAEDGLVFRSPEMKRSLQRPNKKKKMSKKSKHNRPQDRAPSHPKSNSSST